MSGPVTSSVLVLGDLMLDVWVDYETVNRPAEVPGQRRVKYLRTTVFPGGAASFAASLAHFFSAHPEKRHVVVLDPVRREDHGRDRLNYALTAHDVQYMPTDSGREEPTTVTIKRRATLDRLPWFREDLDVATPETAPFPTGLAHALSPQAIALVDYNKGVLFPPGFTKQILAFWRSRTPRPWLLVDAKPALLSWSALQCPELNHPRVIFRCNLDELTQITSGGTVDARVLQWTARHPNAHHVVTCGNNPAWLASNGRQLFSVPPAELTSGSIVGAGDAFSAAFLGSILQGQSLTDALRQAVFLATYTASVSYRTALLTHPPADEEPAWGDGAFTI